MHLERNRVLHLMDDVRLILHYQQVDSVHPTVQEISREITRCLEMPGRKWSSLPT